MKKNIFIITFLLTFNFIFNKLTEEQRENLFKKFTIKVTEKNLDTFNKRFIHKEKLSDTIIYDPTIIKSLIDSMGLEENFTFFNHTDAEIIVKNQQRCGCCWSHSSSSALAYRYVKHGFPSDFSLSPQLPLSCYITDCDAGNYLIDSAMNLVKNGTVTESCFPFQSGDGETMPECPTECEDGTEFKKYYAKEVYMTEQLYSEENFYEIVGIMLDQLVNKGPIVTGIDVYVDFMEWHYDKEKCKNEVYSYDGKSLYAGGHAVAVVGYGKLNDKYYWLLQNSWGTDVCDNGFIKVEFGQIGVENVAFVDPYIPDEEAEKKDINVKFVSIDDSCYMDVSSETDYKLWNNTVEISFKNEDNPDDRTFNFQCNVVNIYNKNTPACFYEELNGEFMHKGHYKYVSYQSLGVENNFTLDDSFKDASFYLYGVNYVYTLFTDTFFVSQQGSKILIYHDYTYGIESNQPPIWPTKNAKQPLSDCEPFDFPYMGIHLTFLLCTIKEEELSEFQQYNSSSDEPMLFSIDCGRKETTDMIVYLLDKTKYPVFYVKKFVAPENKNISFESEISLVVEVQGSVSNIKNNNYFYGVVNVEVKGKNESSLLECNTGIPTEGVKEYNLSCVLLIEGEVEADNLYLKTGYTPIEQEDPYDVIIPNEIKCKINTAYSQINRISMIFILGLFLLL